jgi:hypothetical protein
LRNAARLSDRFWPLSVGSSTVSLQPKADVAHLLSRRPAPLNETLVGLRELLVVHPDFTDDIETRPIRLDHEKFAHNCCLNNNVGDVEIVGNHHQIRGVAVFQNVLQNAFVVQFGLTVRHYARWQQILNSSRATKRKPAGVNATTIGAGQDFPNRNAVSAEGFSDALSLLYTAGRKVYFPRAVPGREPPYPFSDVDVSVAQ